MRIVIDLIGAQTGSRFRGIGRYTVAIVKSIINQRGEHEVFLVANKRLPDGLLHIRKIFEEFDPDIRIEVFDVPMNTSSESWRIEASELIREHFIQRLNPDIVLMTSIIEGHWENAVTSIGMYKNSGVKTAAIFFDLIPLILQDQYLRDETTRKFYFEKADLYRRADLLLCISESSLLEARTHLGMKDSQLANISAATDSPGDKYSFSTSEMNKILIDLSIHQEFIFCAPGGFDPRKNIRRLLEAYSLLPASIRKAHCLVISSKIHPNNQLEVEQWLQEFGIDEEEVILTGYLEDKILHVLYRRAKLFVFPSYHEGFGLPILEAMAEGCPVIGSNTTSIPEVIGLQEAMFNPFSSIAISRKICDSLSNKSFHLKLVNNSKKQAAQFSWEKSGGLALQAISRLNQAPEPTPSINAKQRLQLFKKSMQELVIRHHLSSTQESEIIECENFNTTSFPRLIQ